MSRRESAEVLTVAEKLTPIDLARRCQRTDDLERLRLLRDDLPIEHPERPGLIRAIEYLRSEPLRIDDGMGRDA